MKNNYTIWVCGSGSPNTKKQILESTFEVGKMLAQENIKVIFGGGSKGVMGSIANAMTMSRKKSNLYGVITKHLLPKETDSQAMYVDKVAKDMFSRKKYMMKKSDAYLILVGGVGTIDELFEALVLQAIGEENKPIVVYDDSNTGYIPAIKNLIKVLSKLKVVNPKKQLHSLYYITNLKDLKAFLIKDRKITLEPLV